ncbi:MAG: AEX-3 domain-containing protein [Benjaminiella poitrasii]|nr:MAG: AEX-3 domain-containing protein [Benjaminiella poitrasii]
MSNNYSPSSRVVDYFFVAGLHDSHLIPAFESAKNNNQTEENDASYYQQQEQAVLSQSPPEFDINDTNRIRRKRGYTIAQDHFEENKDDSLLGVLDHVQSVIDHFDKERDIARDNVIAVHDPSIKKHRASIFSMETTRHGSLQKEHTRKWRSPSDPRMLEKRQSISYSLEQEQIVPNIFDLKYTPTVLLRYPKTNYSSNEPFPAYAAMFCFPKDIKLYCGEEPPPERCHSFTMTDENGATVYGTCLVFYEPLTDKLKVPVDEAIQVWIRTNISPSTIEYAQHLQQKIQLEQTKLANFLSSDKIKTCQENIQLYKELLEPVKMAVCTADRVWVPKSIGLLGRMPWMNLYSDWLKILVDNIVGVGGHRKNIKPTIDIESTVINLIDEVPLPPPGRFEIGLTINHKPLFFSRPPMNQVPLLKDFSLFPLFRALSPHLILVILETLLAEGKVVFLSKYTGMLSYACESFRYLLFPFYWQFVFIPVLPERLLTCLQAPVPYIIGFNGTMDELEDHAPEDACIVNLDSNTMHSSQRVTPIPDRQRRKLQSALEQYAPLHTKYKIPYGIPLSVQYAYPKGKMMLNCSRSKTTDVFISPASRVSLALSDATTATWSNDRRSNESIISNNGNNTSSPPLSPIRPTISVQSTNSKRISLPTTTTNNSYTNYYQQNNNKRISEPPPPRRSPSQHDQENLKNRFATLMLKPRAVFHHQQQTSDNNSLGSSSPRISVSSPPSTQFDLNYYNQVPRRTKHIEGHIMAEVFSSELHRFQGFRCVCGKQVTEDEEEGGSMLRMFMCCQECHLVTHDTCTEHILHPCLPTCFNETQVHESFLRMFASLLYNYRTGFVDRLELGDSSITANHDDQKPAQLCFSKDRFIKHSDKDTRTFLSGLSNSQMFTQFITDRLLKSSQEPEILIFDEYIKLKLNRSKLKFVKEDTPFLNDPSFKVSQIIWATPPPEPSIIGQGDCKRFPTNLNFFI